MSQIVCKRLTVAGKVQGVGFRAATLREAIRIGNLSGSVSNLPNGDVLIIVQGDRPSVAQLAAWARQGPIAARVDSVKDDELRVDPSLPRFHIDA